MTRQMIKIDSEKCTGCRQCVDACVGGAIAMVGGKAKLVRSDFCDGLGICIGHCPAGAIELIPCDEPAAKPAAPSTAPPLGENDISQHTCPGTRPTAIPRRRPIETASAAADSALEGWPIQLHLIRPENPAFYKAHLLIAASCTAFAAGDFHTRLLAGRPLIIACPKLDRREGYLEKLVALFQRAEPQSVTVARMEVPCCMGLTQLVRQARQEAGSRVEVRETVIRLDGRIEEPNTQDRPCPSAAGMTGLPIL
jgi:Pyruvate/2-oxoacid:ferredoxin oxidoreductase delta subunit